MIPNQTGESPNPQNEQAKEVPGIVTYLMPRIIEAREYRDGDGRKERWEEYTRLWRGMWGPEDKNRSSERSRLIAPALQQAIEMTVAEMSQATFGRTAWLDIDDDIADEEKEDAAVLRDQLLEDFELNKVPDAIRETYLLGALYGTGISMIEVGERIVKTPTRGSNGALKAQQTSEFFLKLHPIRPDQFIIDPSALHVDDAEIVGREILVPRHLVEQKMADGTYFKANISSYSGGFTNLPKTDGRHQRRVGEISESVLITDICARVPAQYVPGAEPGPDGRVEAIVTLGNEGTVLRLMESPYTLQDRPFVAYQHEKVPGEFWGRGVAEKGYNPQKALDSELRARIDNLAITTRPLMGADVTRLPRNPDLRVRPGKIFLTRGKPSEILEPIQFPPTNPVTFQQSGDLERMVQMGTGAMDSATPNNISRRNETAGGMSMMNAGFIKRNNITMHNVEINYLDEIVRRSLNRYMQFAPDRYPTDYKLVVNSTMGIMAREVEQAQLTTLLSFVPPDASPQAHKLILGAILMNTSSANEKELRAAFKEMTKPPSEEEQQQAKVAEELRLRLQQAEVAKVEAEVRETLAKAQLDEAKAYHEMIMADLEDDLVEIQAANAVTGAERVKRGTETTAANLAGKVLDAETKRQVEAAKAKKQTPTGGNG